MLKAGDLLDLGPLGAKFLITKTAVDTAGQSFEMEWELAPRTGGTPVHIHPHAAETYKVIEGQLDIYVDGKWDTLSAGEERTVPERVAHTFRNASDEIARVYNTHGPALRFDEYFEGLHRMVARGIVSQRGMTPKALLHLALLMTSYPNEIISVKPPDLLMRLLGRLGRSLGYHI
jgi:mannose-6-phosphate isomerase-like protein (cupin superfamily)